MKVEVGTILLVIQVMELSFMKKEEENLNYMSFWKVKSNL